MDINKERGENMPDNSDRYLALFNRIEKHYARNSEAMNTKHLASWSKNHRKRMPS